MVVLGFGLMTTCGYLFSMVLTPKLKIVERVGIGYVLGLGLVTFVMYYLPIFGIPFSVISVGLPVVMLTIALFSMIILSRPLRMPRVDLFSLIQRFKVKFAQLTSFELLIIFFLIAIVLLSLLLALYWPVYNWDSLWIFDFSAKVFYQSRTVDIEIWQLPRLAHRPLLEPLAHVWLYLLGGSQPHVIHWIFFIATLMIFYGLLRDSHDRLTALIATLILGSTPLIFYHSTIALSNLPATSYFVPGIILLDRWFYKGDRGDLRIGAVMFAMAFWARQSSDPYLLAGLMILALKSLKHRSAYTLFVIALTVIMVNLPWNIVKSLSLGEASFYYDKMNFFFTPSIRRLASVLWTMVTELWDWDNYYGFVGLLLLITIAVQPSRLRTHSTIPAVIGLALVTATGVLYVIHGDQEPVRYFFHVLDDMTLPLVPLAVYWSVPAIMEMLGKREIGGRGCRRST